MNNHTQQQAYIKYETRRQFFGKLGLGLGTAALADLTNPMQAFSQPAGDPMAQLPHFAPKAKRVIYLFMAGAPSQLDMYDHKPEMKNCHDKDLP